MYSINRVLSWLLKLSVKLYLLLRIWQGGIWLVHCTLLYPVSLLMLSGYSDDQYRDHLVGQLLGFDRPLFHFVKSRKTTPCAEMEQYCIHASCLQNRWIRWVWTRWVSMRIWIWTNFGAMLLIQSHEVHKCGFRDEHKSNDESHVCTENPRGKLQFKCHGCTIDRRYSGARAVAFWTLCMKSPSLPKWMNFRKKTFLDRK